MENIIILNTYQFLLVYLLLLIILGIMKKCKVDQTKLLVIASIRMTVQLVLSGFVLTLLFNNPHPLLVLLYVFVIIVFSIQLVLSRNKNINKKFKVIVGLSIATSGISVLIFFLAVVVSVNIFNPQYAIPIAGMLMGNTVTGISLAVKTFNEMIVLQKDKIDSMLNIGAHPKVILSPIINKTVETALLPTLTSMLSMGIISLPGMMTGQILSGTLPMTAVLYQIAIMIAITSVTSIAVFTSIYYGSRTVYNEKYQFLSN